jgi:hypothetical protein
LMPYLCRMELRSDPRGMTSLLFFGFDDQQSQL